MSDSTLRMYAIIRSDLDLYPGKIASQTGHAFVGAFVSNKDSTLLSEYHSNLPDSPGTKIVLKGNLGQVQRAQEELTKAGLPHFLVVDSGCQNFFEGKPTVTALGFGPARKHQLPKFIQRLHLL